MFPDIIRESLLGEVHSDYIKGADGVRSKDNGINKDVSIHVLYGAVESGDNIYRVKTRLKLYEDKNRPNKPYSYEVTQIELLSGTLDSGKTSIPRPSNSGSLTKTAKPVSSIKVTNLLKGVEKSYEKGKYLLDSKLLDINGEPKAEDISKFESEKGDTVYRSGEFSPASDAEIGEAVRIGKSLGVEVEVVNEPGSENAGYYDTKTGQIVVNSATGGEACLVIYMTSLGARLKRRLIF